MQCVRFERYGSYGQYFGRLDESGSSCALFCLALEFGLWYKTRASRKGEERVSTWEDCGESGSESEKSKSEELRLAFKIDNNVLNLVFEI